MTLTKSKKDVVGNAADQAQMLIRRLVNAKESRREKHRFSPSKLPYCATRHAWFRLYDEAKREVKQDFTFSNSFYVEVGKAVHTSVQYWLGSFGILYGQWRCRWAVESATRIYPARRPPCSNLTVYGPSLLPPGGCPDCGGDLQYVELRVRYDPTDFEGFVDGLVKLPGLDLADDEFVILEIKTTKTGALRDIVKPGGVKREYMMQATVYAHLLAEMGYRIRGVMFLFVPRDDHSRATPVWVDRLDRFAAASFEATMQEYTNTLRAFEAEQYDRINGICSSAYDASFCPFATNCFSPAGTQLFVQLHTQARGRAPKSLPVLPG